MCLAQSEVMDAFLGFCDSSRGNSSMNLGSCQIAAVKGDTALGPEMRKLTLEELWGDVGNLQHGEGSSEEDARLAQESLVCFLMVFSTYAMFHSLMIWMVARIHRGNGLPRSLPHGQQQRPKQKVQRKMKKPASAACVKKPARTV